MDPGCSKKIRVRGNISMLFGTFTNPDQLHYFLLGLSREQLIQMALLVGSDYTVGIEGIGPVTAMEILAYFSDKNNRPETEADIAETLQKFRIWVKKNRDGKSVLARKVKNVKLSEGRCRRIQFLVSFD